MKKRFALLIIAPLLIIAFAPAFCQGDGDPQGLNFCDGFSHLYALTSPFFHFDRDPKWTSLSYSPILMRRPPQVLPLVADTRAPPA